jgi:hypothetical protein
VAAGLTVLMAVCAWAAVDVSGKWTWTQRFGDNEVMNTMELKQEGEKLTGTIQRQGSDQKSEIKEGKIKENDLSFVVIRERNGQEFKISYKGKVEGETIKGQMLFNFQGEDRTVDWMATKAK